MTRTQIWWTAAGILGAAALVAAMQQRTVVPSAPPLPVGKGWADPAAPQRIRQLAAPIEQLARWPGLGHYLVAVAWRESRGNPDAYWGMNQGEPPPHPDVNTARGLFQLRPQSARVGDLGMSGGALFDPATSVALAAWYAHRLRPYAASGQTMDWAAVNRGWAYPSLVPDVGESSDRSRSNRKKLEKGLTQAGMPTSFMYQPAFPPGYQWPGIDAVLAAVGRARVA